MGRKLEIYGVQNIVSSFTFKNKDYKQILNKIFSLNPSLAKAEGKAFRSFSWNPFKKKAFVMIYKGLLIHSHPKRKDRVALEGVHVKDVKRYGRFYHLFKDVVIDTCPPNIRYDEDSKILQPGIFLIDSSKIKEDDKWLRETTDPLFVLHMWTSSAKRLEQEVRSVIGEVSTARVDYELSEQAQKDLEEKLSLMASYENKPSLILFITKLRAQTGCAPLSEQSDINIAECPPCIDSEVAFNGDAEIDAVYTTTPPSINIENNDDSKKELLDSTYKKVASIFTPKKLLIGAIVLIILVVLPFLFKMIKTSDTISFPNVENNLSEEAEQLEANSDLGIFDVIQSFEGKLDDFQPPVTLEEATSILQKQLLSGKIDLSEINPYNSSPTEILSHFVIGSGFIGSDKPVIIALDRADYEDEIERALIYFPNKDKDVVLGKQITILHGFCKGTEYEFEPSFSRPTQEDINNSVMISGMWVWSDQKELSYLVGVYSENKEGSDSPHTLPLVVRLFDDENSDNSIDSEETNQEITSAEDFLNHLKINGMPTEGSIGQFHWLSDHDFTSDDFIGFSSDDLRHLRNAIYAMHGYRFSSADLSNYFNQFYDYSAQTSNPPSLSHTELKNVANIKANE